ncbi:hypothetical protein ACIBQ6_44080 [Nonomuraea sp. NPDC049655]|uniref:hypothetical protein n=1 Tax=Nonomuraea sp. NPDC049655 TaxID=3364355 RepID=UPI0037A09FE6
MDDASEPVVSADGQVNDTRRFDDRIRDGAEWCCLVEGLMGAVLVVELLVLAEGVAEVVFVPQEAAVEEFTAARLHHRSMMEFMRGIRMPVSTVWMPASARIPSMRVGNFPSLSRIRKRARQPASSGSITRFLIVWIRKSAVG